MNIHLNDFVRITYDGKIWTSRIVCYGVALETIAEKFFADPYDLVTKKSHDYDLIWLSEADAANDDPQKAIARIDRV